MSDTDAAVSGPPPPPLQLVPETPKVDCVLCSTKIEAGARICTTCNAYQTGKDCNSCGKWIPRGAGECPECKNYQDLRRYIPINTAFLAMLIALISVVSAFGPGLVDLINNRSITTGYVVASDFDEKSKTKRIIFFHAANGGGRPSVVTGVDLDLTAIVFPVRRDRLDKPGVVQLQMMGKDRDVGAHKDRELKLIADDRDFAFARSRARSLLYLLCTADVELTLHVDERNLLGNLHRESYPIPVRGSIVRAFVADRLSMLDPGACK